MTTVPRPTPAIPDAAPAAIGRGRSAVVYLDRTEAARPVARKVFTGDAASRVVLYILTGAGNPYGWSEAAVRCAVARRRVLSRLVRLWFGDRLRLPETIDWSWDETARAHALATEFIDGRHLPLRGPDDEPGLDLLRDLREHIMKPLQGHLGEAGVDGLLWQAGRGNPVATSNFMLESNGAASEDAPPRWVWIDLESGVPALFALNPLATLGYYLPKSVKHRGWLFDDVDLPRLRAYLESQREALAALGGADDLAALDDDVDELQRQQDAWKSLPRHIRGITCERLRGRLTDEEAAWYRTRPLRWSGRMVRVGLAGGARALGRLAGRLGAFLHWRVLRHFGHRVWRFCISQRFRWYVARWYVGRSIRMWQRRRFLDRAAARDLRRQLREDEASAYLTDFLVHIAIKGIVKPMQYWVFPALWALGVVNELTVATVIVMGGAIARTLYTLGRMAQAFAQGRRLPWVALVVGFLPIVGNAAYPAQLLYCSAAETRGLARFILYDALARMGRAVPIWGGPDSLLEHRFNRLGDVFARWLGRR